MGSRLGVIVLSESGPELYYDHWAAQTIGIDIAVDGFEPTLARVREMEPMGVNTPAEWEGATWIEGSLLIDLTQRRVVWAEEIGYEYLPRIVNHLIERTWPGWTALWAPEGVRGILWLAGVDPATIFTPTQYSERTVGDLRWFVPWGENDDGNYVISVRLDSERLVAWRISSFIDVIAEYGSDLIHSVAEEALARGTARGRVLWDSQPRDERPGWGIHVDFRTKKVRWWTLGYEDTQIDAFDALWPDWSVESVGDAYEMLESIIGKPLQNWSTEVDTVRRTIQKMVGQGPQENPILGIATRMADLGMKISIDSSALKFRAASDFGGAQRAIAALDALDPALPLPPGRIVNRHGHILEPR